jgi:hypothetical protein
MRNALFFTLLIGISACRFEAPPADAHDLPAGSACTGGDQCRSGECTASSGAVGMCNECSATLACTDGRTCDPSGRCLEPSGTHRHVAVIGGARQTNETGRVHIGRVAVTPVESVVLR